jgi:hypothetical protein
MHVVSAKRIITKAIEITTDNIPINGLTGPVRTLFEAI